MKKVIFFIIIASIGCTDVDPVSTCTDEIAESNWKALDQTQLQNDIQAIDDYLTANNITAVEHPSGLRYVITKAGTGDNIPCTQNVFSVLYEGRLLTNNSIFDSATKPVPFILSNLILGWQIAFLELNKGAKATLYIPSGLAYGTNSGSIPANSNLIFDVELLDWR